MNQIDSIKIKQAVKEGQIKFFILEQYDGKYIYCKDEVGETVIVGKVKENVNGEWRINEICNWYSQWSKECFW